MRKSRVFWNCESVTDEERNSQFRRFQPVFLHSDTQSGLMGVCMPARRRREAAAGVCGSSGDCFLCADWSMSFTPGEERGSSRSRTKAFRLETRSQEELFYCCLLYHLTSIYIYRHGVHLPLNNWLMLVVAWGQKLSAQPRLQIAAHPKLFYFSTINVFSLCCDVILRSKLSLNCMTMLILLTFIELQELQKLYIFTIYVFLQTKQQH